MNICFPTATGHPWQETQIFLCSLGKMKETAAIVFSWLVMTPCWLQLVPVIVVTFMKVCVNNELIWLNHFQHPPLATNVDE